mmetsp:Transcript_132652/g.424478  ORF Transcript_132652/g.424478 Transcript_132652/m.424478 type:complete len:863 (-) Transcript_132652:68-2656(-)
MTPWWPHSFPPSPQFPQLCRRHGGQPGRAVANLHLATAVTGLALVLGLVSAGFGLPTAALVASHCSGAPLGAVLRPLARLAGEAEWSRWQRSEGRVSLRAKKWHQPATEDQYKSLAVQGLLEGAKSKKGLYKSLLERVERVERRVNKPDVAQRKRKVYGLTPAQEARRDFLFRRLQDVNCRVGELENVMTDLWQERLMNTEKAYTILVSSLAKRGLVKLVERALKDMEASGYPPNVFAYSAAISASEKSAKKDPEGQQWLTALDLLGRLRNSGTPPNAVAYNAAISTCGKNGHWQAALQLFADLERRDSIEEEDRPTEVTYAAVMDAFKRAGQWEKAVALKEFMIQGDFRGNLITWSTCIHACERAEQPKLAMKVYGEMKQVGFAPDRPLYGILLRACGKLGNWRRAVELFDTMKDGDGGPPDANEYTYLISACARGGENGLAMNRFADMLDAGLKMIDKTYAAVATAYLKSGKAKEAIETFEYAQENNALTPDTFAVAMQACQVLGMHDRQFELFQEYRNNERMRPDAEVWSSAVESANATGKQELALDWAEQMESDGLQPSPTACVAALASWESLNGMPEQPSEASVPFLLQWLFRQGVQGFARAKMPRRALDLLAEMRLRGVLPDGETYATAIEACSLAPKDRATTLAMKLLEEASESSVHVGSESYEAIMRMHLRKFEWRPALDVFDRLGASPAPPSGAAFGAALEACAEGAAWSEALGLLALATKRRIDLPYEAYKAAEEACDVAGKFDRADAIRKSIRAKGLENTWGGNSIQDKGPRADLIRLRGEGGADLSHRISGQRGQKVIQRREKLDQLEQREAEGIVEDNPFAKDTVSFRGTDPRERVRESERNGKKIIYF